MKQFKDRHGHQWDLSVDVGAIQRVRELVQLDLFRLFHDEAKRLFADPVLLVNTLYVLCRRQADERKMTDQDFGEAFDGDALDAAGSALIDATVDFFPNARRRILRATVEKAARLASEMEPKALAAIEALSVTDLLNASASREKSA